LLVSIHSYAPMAQHPIVAKFGGAVLQSPAGFEALCSRVRELLPTPLVLVISALAGVTRRLESAARAAERGDDAAAHHHAEALLSMHLEYCQRLFPELSLRRRVEGELLRIAEQLRRYLRGIAITQELTPRTLDRVRACGELWAFALVEAFLRREGFALVPLPASELIITDARHGFAQPLWEPTQQQLRQKLLPALQPNTVVLTQGFIARSQQGELTTMGQESSALTAALLAAMLHSSPLLLWTDVAGIRRCDPKLVPDAALLPQLSYAQAHRLAAYGLKLLYPRMLSVLEQHGVEAEIRSAFCPTDGCTRIGPADGELPPVLVTREGLRLYRFRCEQVPPQLRLLEADGCSLFARWEDGETFAVLISSDLAAPGTPEASSEGTLLTLLDPTPPLQRAVLQHCADDPSTVLFWGRPQLLQCFFPGQPTPQLLQQLYRLLQ
jgi:aspartate kinase